MTTAGGDPRARARPCDRHAHLAGRPSGWAGPVRLGTPDLRGPATHRATSRVQPVRAGRSPVPAAHLAGRDGGRPTPAEVETMSGAMSVPCPSTRTL